MVLSNWIFNREVGGEALIKTRVCLFLRLVSFFPQMWLRCESTDVADWLSSHYIQVHVRCEGERHAVGTEFINSL